MDNILLITTDQFRYDYIGAMGKQPVKTPNIDYLYNNGAVHTNAYTVNPICMPARCSLLTGLYSHQHGIQDNRGDLNNTLCTLSQALQNLGYETSIIGKMHFYEGIPDKLDYTTIRSEVKSLGFDYTWLTCGKSMSEFCMDDWTYHLQRKGLLEQYRKDVQVRNLDQLTNPTFLAEEDTVDYRTAEEAMQYLNDYSADKPFFMWLSFCNPHFPFDALEDLQKQYLESSFPLPAGFDGDEAFYKRHAQSYAALVEQVDSYIGKVLATLKEKGLLNTTMVVFTADHGEMLCDHGLLGKTVFYDGSARVPFIALHPRKIPSGKFNEATEITDVAATFLEFAGENDIQKYLPESSSQSLLKLWNGGSFQRQYAFYENGYQFSEPYRALCNGQWKYINFSFSGEERLFNLKKDPDELNDIAIQNPELVSEFRNVMLKRIGSTPSPIPAFWINEKITGRPSEKKHHGPDVKNNGLFQIY